MDTHITTAAHAPTAPTTTWREQPALPLLLSVLALLAWSALAASYLIGFIGESLR